MAVATPVLERKIENTQEEVRYSYNSGHMEDEVHNSKIKDIFQQIMNPETKMSDLRTAAPVQQDPQQVVQAPAPVRAEARFVEGARTNAELFRADSIINRQATSVQEEVASVVATIAVSDEENEDLMPTRTTMQYNAENKDMDAEGTVVNKSAEKHIHFTKRDKIAIAVVVSIIVALFALIIVNSIIISNLNSDLSTLQTSLNSARGAYESVTSEIADYESNFDETLRALAESLGMVR